MTLEKTAICEFDKKAEYFELLSTENKLINLNDCKGENGLLIMFICNHCPYVIATINDIVRISKEIKKYKINSIAIMSNDPLEYPEDSFENMISFSKKYNFDFPYVIDKDQSIGKKYDAKCTPDFFGFNLDLELQYRGRIYELDNETRPRTRLKNSKDDLMDAMITIAKTGKGPREQDPGVGCGIKWFK
tara:strand:+ start:75 stop:641 length:567 start_codon:yes stop_codon:yes gene_type:complete